MLLLIDGSSDIDAQGRSSPCYLFCLRHLISSRALARIFGSPDAEFDIRNILSEKFPRPMVLITLLLLFDLFKSFD